MDEIAFNSIQIKNQQKDDRDIFKSEFEKITTKLEYKQDIEDNKTKLLVMKELLDKYFIR